MRLYPPTEGMKTPRYLAQIALLLIAMPLVQLACFCLGHRWGKLIAIREHRWNCCKRCGAERHWTVDGQEVKR